MAVLVGPNRPYLDGIKVPVKKPAAPKPKPKSAPTNYERANKALRAASAPKPPSKPPAQKPKGSGTVTKKSTSTTIKASTSAPKSKGTTTVAKKTAAPAKPKVPTEAEWLKANPADADASYIAAKAAYEKAHANALADINARQGLYAKDFNNSLRDLGSASDGDGWEWRDLTTASGRARENLVNDFAARGMLRGSGFGTASNDLLNSLTDQRKRMTVAKEDFDTRLEGERKTANDTLETSIQQALAEALARRQAQYETVRLTGLL